MFVNLAYRIEMVKLGVVEVKRFVFFSCLLNFLLGMRIVKMLVNLKTKGQDGVKSWSFWGKTTVSFSLFPGDDDYKEGLIDPYGMGVIVLIFSCKLAIIRGKKKIWKKKKWVPKRGGSMRFGVCRVVRHNFSWSYCASVLQQSLDWEVLLSFRIQILSYLFTLFF